MTLSRLSAISEIISSIAILATLVYLAIEVTQNTKLLEADSLQATMDGDVQLALFRVNDPSIGQSFVNPDMTDREKEKLNTFLFAWMRIKEADWLKHESGIMDEATFATYKTSLVGPLASLNPYKWWNHFKGQGLWNAGFEAYVDEVLEGVEITPDRRGAYEAFD